MTSVEVDYAALTALTDRQLERLIAAARREQKRRGRPAEPAEWCSVCQIRHPAEQHLPPAEGGPVPKPQSLRVKP